MRLAGVSGINYSGRVEVFYHGKWGKICRNEWDIDDVKVVCKELGFQSALAEFIGMDTKDGNVSIVMSNVTCTGTESALASCKRSDGDHKCVDNTGAQALCEPSKLAIEIGLCLRCALCHAPLCGVHYYASCNFMAMNFEAITCSDQRNISKVVTKQEISEYSISFRAILCPRSQLTGARKKGPSP